ncbi:MAG: hypothetical protein WC976_06745 [Caldisericia bacterium]
MKTKEEYGLPVVSRQLEVYRILKRSILSCKVHPDIIAKYDHLKTDEFVIQDPLWFLSEEFAFRIPPNSLPTHGGNFSPNEIVKKHYLEVKNFLSLNLPECSLAECLKEQFNTQEFQDKFLGTNIFNLTWLPSMLSLNEILSIQIAVCDNIVSVLQFFLFAYDSGQSQKMFEYYNSSPRKIFQSHIENAAYLYLSTVCESAKGNIPMRPCLSFLETLSEEIAEKALSIYIQNVSDIARLPHVPFKVSEQLQEIVYAMIPQYELLLSPSFQYLKNFQWDTAEALNRHGTPGEIRKLPLAITYFLCEFLVNFVSLHAHGLIMNVPIKCWATIDK